jgi:uncharacterized protein YqgC (DUF456 family)
LSSISKSWYRAITVQIVLWILGVLLIIAGLIGVVVPVLPGTLLVFVGMALGAWADGFVHIGWGTLAILALLALASYLLDFAAGLIGVRRLGASKWAVWGAAIGTVVGLFFGLPGLLLGPFIGAVLGEYAVRRQLKEAGKAGAGAWIGMVVGAAAKVALIGIMIGIFLAALLL